jgi:multicomponent K+:H+ antiporter subunit G
MSEGLRLVAGVLALLGSGLFLAGAIGLLRLPDFYTRLHAPTKAATLGVALIALGSTTIHAGGGMAVWIEDALVMLFVMLTAPVSSQVLARAAAARRVEQLERTRGEPLPPDEPGGSKGARES